MYLNYICILHSVYTCIIIIICISVPLAHINLWIACRRPTFCRKIDNPPQKHNYIKSIIRIKYKLIALYAGFKSKVSPFCN